MCRNDRELPRLLDWSLHRSEKARSYVDPNRAKHQCRRNAASIKYSACRDDRNGRDRVNDLRNKSQGAYNAAVAAGLAALRDNYVSTALGCFNCLFDCGYLNHHFRSDVMGLLHKIARVTQGRTISLTAAMQGYGGTLPRLTWVEYDLPRNFD